MKTIIIAGCSWGAGSWGMDGEIDHPGLAKYLMDIGYNVVNLSQPGLGPFSILQPIEYFLHVNSDFLDIEHIFVLQSDIARDFVPWDRFTATTTYKLRVMDNSDLDNNIKHTYCDFYDKLNFIAEKRQFKISLIGGLTDLVMKFELEFSHLNFIVPSWIQLMHPDAMPVYMHQLEKIPEQHKDKQQLLPFMDATNAIRKIFDESPYFPDNFHPDRHGHKILFNYLQDLGLFHK